MSHTNPLRFNFGPLFRERLMPFVVAAIMSCGGVQHDVTPPDAGQSNASGGSSPGGAATGGVSIATGGMPGVGGISSWLNAGGSGGVMGAGTCPNNVAAQPCGSSLSYCITYNSSVVQTCACTQGHWYCFGP